MHIYIESRNICHLPATTGLSLTASWTATAVGSADVFGVALLAVASTSRKHRLAVGSPYFGRDDMEQMHPGMVHVFAPTHGGKVTPKEVAAWGAHG